MIEKQETTGGDICKAPLLKSTMIIFTNKQTDVIEMYTKLQRIQNNGSKII